MPIKIDEIAKDLNLPPDKLMRDSLLTYLQNRLREVDIKLFELARKYGVKTIEELDGLIKEGKFREEDTFEDYFKFDNLEAEKETIQKEIKKLQ